jgi:autophagy-related protein 2
MAYGRVFNILFLVMNTRKGKRFYFGLLLKLMKGNSSEIKYCVFRSFLFSREVPIRLDYQGKRVDMTHGPLAGLLMGLGQLNCSELRLKRISHRHG